MALKPSAQVVNFPRRARHARHTPWRAALATLDARVAAVERKLHPSRSVAEPLPLRMYTALGISVLVHLAILYGLTVRMPNSALLDNQRAQMEVVLVNAKSKAQPTKADALAQHNLDGGGNTDAQRQAQSPLPVLPDQQPEAEVKLALRRVEQLQREARQLMTQTQSTRQVETTPVPVQGAATQAPAPEAIPAPQASDLVQRSLEIARLEAKIARDWDEIQQRPRRRFIGARTQEYRFARYVEDWRQKIERVGEMNYPEAAREQNLSGTLMVTVAIKADGSVERVDINKPSGSRVLDEAARRIVQLAAPFGAFPPDIAKDVDVLHITRTWTFTRADRFVSE